MQEDGLDPEKAEADFGKRVKDLRVERKWTQKKLAEAIEVDASAISRIEQGVRAVRLGEAAQIAHALGVDLDELVFGDDMSPAQWLERNRTLADIAMHRARSAAVHLANAYVSIAQLLTDEPDLFTELEDADSRRNPPTDLPEYFEWVLDRIRALFDPAHHNRAYTSNAAWAEQISKIVHGIMDGVVSTVPLLDQSDDDDAET